MNWRKESAAQERRIGKGMGIVFYIIGLVVIARAVFLWIDNAVIIGVSATKMQPIIHTPAYDALMGAVFLIAGWGFRRSQ